MLAKSSNIDDHVLQMLTCPILALLLPFLLDGCEVSFWSTQQHVTGSLVDI
jgi:hypothetical protein